MLYSTDDPPVPYLIENRVIVSGENLVDAQATFDQRTSEPVVSFRFDSKGAQRFGQATQQNVGKLFAIILDNQVISAPQIREPILGGTGQISGNFTAQSANDLAVLLRAGALPADLTIVEERTVGPSLGADSIDAGKFASLIAGVLVVGFMLVAYGTLGLIANIALAANVALIIAILSVLGATLTMPGIAGIVLTIGMAVDSNVIIYERVREERRLGRSLVQSLDSGFARALATIVDANFTTFIAAVILFYLGSGPVRGFAVTLAIGIVTTVFTAFTLTRWLIAIWLRRMRPKELPNGLFRFVPDDTHDPLHGLAQIRLHAVGGAVDRRDGAVLHHRDELRHRLPRRLQHRGAGQGRRGRPGRRPRTPRRAQSGRRAGAGVRLAARPADPHRGRRAAATMPSRAWSRRCGSRWRTTTTSGAWSRSVRPCRASSPSTAPWACSPRWSPC